MMVTSELTYIKLSEVSLLPYNPRKIKKADFDRLIDSIKINGFWKHRPLAIEVQDGKNFVLCGNQRVKAAKKLKLKELPAVFYSELTDDERVDLITRDNISNGEWDQTVLDTDPHFQDLDFEFMGLILPGTDDDQPKKKKGKKKLEAETDPEGSGEDPEEEDFPDEPTQEQKMLDDVLFPSNNKFEIPTLLKEMEAGRVVLPITPWGANSRLRKDVNTYHFYVDDYRFEKLFKDPTNLINSGVILILSGINDERNVGTDVLYSGTVSGAIEANLCGYPAMAISTTNSNFDIVKSHFPVIFEKLLSNKLSISIINPILDLVDNISSLICSVFS